MNGNVVLIGMMGCGKTTVGGLLAQQLGFTFVDTDQYIETTLGRSIPDLFAREGEAFFRER
ncbi:shikimate kinase, partial [Pseudoflavonifractor phocaeensis]|uniref:shikimate kinase n=1 Tax=Pseudoflavonifractor phocaeensis TaxID=1870988 RepID=UPI0019595531